MKPIFRKFAVIFTLAIVAFPISSWGMTNEQFFEFCKNGTGKDVRQAITKNKININAITDNRGWTPLMVAMLYANDAAVVELLKAKANVNATEKTNGQSVLTLACRFNYSKNESRQIVTLKRLLKAGANVNPKERWSPLGEACSSARPEVVRLLLRAGAQVNPKGQTPPLVYACEMGSSGCVKALLEAGAKVNFWIKRPNWANKNYTPLLIASACGASDCIELLIKAGADFRVRLEDGSTPLMLVADSRAYTMFRNVPVNQVQSARILLNADFNIEERDNRGNTALICAAKCGDAELIEYLLSLGANKRVHNNEGYYAVDYVDKNSNIGSNAKRLVKQKLALR